MVFQYLIESSLLDGDTFLQYLPSVTAAAAICLANLMLGSADPWVSELDTKFSTLLLSTSAHRFCLTGPLGAKLMGRSLFCHKTHAETVLQVSDSVCFCISLI